MTFDLVGNGAVISPDGVYRYRLDRHVGGTGPVYAFFGVNPSTADADTDDATVRKWRGFCRRLGARRFIVGNVFALRATDVREIGRHPHPIGGDWRHHVDQIIAEADVLVPCWGSTDKVPASLRSHFDTTLGILLTSGKPVKCWGHTASGDPRHPLMLAYSTRLQDW